MMKTCNFNTCKFSKSIYLAIILLAGGLIIVSCKQKTARDYYEEGYEYASKSDFEQAIKHYKKAIKKDKTFKSAYLGLGNAYYNLRDRESALNYYNLAIEVDSSYADAYYNRGQLKFYAGDEYGACLDYAEAYFYGRPNMDDIMKRCFNLYLVRPRTPKEPWDE